MVKEVDKVKKAMSSPKKKKVKQLFLSTGYAPLNLGLSGRVFGGIKTGKITLFVGDSDSGKTFLILASLAEACRNSKFKGYRIIYDVPEGVEMDMVRKLYGEELVRRMEPPARDEKGRPVYSSTVEELYFHIDDAVKKDTPFIYAIDSETSLGCDSHNKKFEIDKTLYRRGQKKQKEEDHDEDGDIPKARGSFGVEKAKVHSEKLKRLLKPLRQTRSVLLLVTQSRDLIQSGGRPMWGIDPRTRPGGRALKFYAVCEVWTSIAGKIQRKIKKKNRRLGIYVKAHIQKNHVTGRDVFVRIPVYWSFGIDDLGGCVDYLIDEYHWKGTKEKVKAPEFNFQGSKEDLIQKIEEEGSEKKLRKLVGKVWNTIQEACKIHRKKRYL